MNRQKLRCAQSLTLLVLASYAVEAVAETIQTIDMAEAKNLSTKVWPDPVKVDDRKCRVLAPGKRGTVPLKPWWKDALRPPRGSAFLAKVDYKDTAKSPIRVELFAGLPKNKEIHRIGGLADGKWKTAFVPIPWDMIMRIPGQDHTEMHFYAPAGEGVPFSKIEIVPGDAEKDEKRWAAETRAWTARVQAEKRKNPRLPKPQTASIPDALKDQKVLPFVRSTVRMIYPNSAPQKGETGVPLKVRMAKNEIEPAQFGIHANGADLKKVSIEIKKADVPSSNGKAFNGTIELFTAEYSVTRYRKHLYFPQRLWPAYPVDIKAGGSHLFWINAESLDGKTEAGTYKGKITITADGGLTAQLPLEIKVLPFRILTMKEAGLHMGSCTSGLVPAHELETLVRHNQNSIDLFSYALPFKFTKKPDGDFDIDFTIHDDFMGHAAKAGMENFVYFLGGDPYIFPDNLELERELYRRVYYDGKSMQDTRHSLMMRGRIEQLKKTSAAPNKIIPEIRPLYKKWVAKFMAHAKEKGWPEPLLTPFDEPAKWTNPRWGACKQYLYYTKEGRERLPSVPNRENKKFMERMKKEGITPELISKGGEGAHIKAHFKDSCAAIHEAWPSARIYGSIHHARSGIVFAKDVEVFCTNAIHQDHKLGDKVRAAGPNKVFWQYQGCTDARELSEGRYGFGFYFAAFGSKGSLCWAYNIGRRFDTSEGSNWIYAWTTPYSVARAPFFEGVREAWDDRRFLQTLKRLAKGTEHEKPVAEMLNKMLDAAVKNRTKAGGRDTVRDFYARSQDPEVLDSMRDKIIVKILEINRSGK